MGKATGQSEGVQEALTDRNEKKVSNVNLDLIWN
jgi:hypothetical protein